MAELGLAGRDGANRELKNRLKTALAHRGLSQADLVRQTQLNGESVSKAAVSNALNREKGPPSATTLRAILDAAGICGTERDELSRLRDRAESRGTAQLEAYLEAARKAARQHPYPGVMSAPNLPALADVYVRQQARAPADQAGSVVPAAELFGQDRAMCLLLGGPGGGKSTLLRAHLAESADSWLGGSRTGNTVPVMARAAALTGAEPLPMALAKTVTGDLGQVGLLDGLGADFFRHPPRGGESWLVLVDGLDEIPDTDSRSAVLTMLHRAAEAVPGLYRFVVATRPLPARELGTLGWHVSHYKLQPFSHSDLLTYATRWFRFLEDPGRHAEAFVAWLKRAHLEVLARTPLMAFMLCQLYAADPARPLPDGRSGAYQLFVELIYEQNRHKQVAETHDKAIRELKDRYQIPRDNEAAEQAAQQVRHHLPELIDHLAYERINGNVAPAVEVLASHLQGSRLQKVKQHLWYSFLADLLRPTGILAQRGDDFHFLHQTLLEYHAARHATRSKEARTDLLHQLFASTVADGGHMESPDGDASYLGFLLDGLFAPQDHLATRTAQHLEDLTAHGGRHTCDFLTQQVRMATSLPPGPTARQLIRFAQDPNLTRYAHVSAAEALAGMEGHHEDGVALLVRFAQDQNSYVAAETLAGVEGHREEGAALLARIAQDPSLSMLHTRYKTMLALLRTGADTTATLLTRIAENLNLPGNEHVRAAKALAGVEGHREDGAALLARFAQDPKKYGYLAAEALAGVEGHREEGAALLARIAQDLTLPDGIAHNAMRALADTGADATATLLTRIAENPNLSGYEHVSAAEALAGVEGHREDGAALLARFAQDPNIAGHNQWHAVRALANAGADAALLIAIAENLNLAAETRVEAAWAVARHATPARRKGIALLVSYAQDLTLDGFSRVSAANGLVHTEGCREDGIALLTQLAQDSTLNDHVREHATRSINPPRYGPCPGEEDMECL
ncbi:hypothetical protein [Streptomyces sp. NPDC058155]|uniref:NACHT domain-containing protein n=1 Tax=Streptomyces sp. NPDC058155 TaxID=3346359 RepID=UPI0036E8F21D